MNDQLLVLNALLRLSRRRVPASLPELDVRVDATASRVRAALAALAAAGLVTRCPGSSAAAQLTLEGFALAVALAKKTASRGGRRPATRPARSAA
jgi:predicted transcriptional regulator